MMAVAITAITFAACEDVPAPYEMPTPAKEEEVTYTGKGTLESPYTVEDVVKYVQALDGNESDTAVYVKGVVKSITEEFTTNYGNATFVMTDEGGTTEFTAYRVKYLGNKKYANGDTQIKEGDKVIVYGNVVNYRGNTPETVQNTAFLYELNGVSNGGSGNGGETGTPAGTGTEADPYNVAGVLKYIATLGSDVTSPNEVYIKGKVKEITEEYGTQYGNGTFKIQDEGVNNEFYCYRIKYLGNEKYQSGQTQIKVGDEVIVCAKVVNFRGNTPETAQNEGFLYSLNGVTGGNGGGGGETGTPAGTGTQADPYNVAAILKYIATLGSDVTSEKEYYIKGKVKSVTEAFNTNYGNGTFKIQDDGVNNEFLCYRVKYLGNEKYQAGWTQIKDNDEVVVCAKVVNFHGNTPETAQNSGYLYSLNGSTEPTQGGEQGGEGGEQGGEQGGQGGEQTADGYVITMSDFGLANQADATTLTAGDGTKLTFSQEGGRNAPKYYTAAGGAVRMYALNSLTITSAKTITKVVITTTEPYQGTPYNGNDTMYGEAGSNKVTPKKDSDTQVTFDGFSSTSLKIVNDHDSNSGGTQLRIVKLTITYAE